jgi:hypothetical protein
LEILISERLRFIEMKRLLYLILFAASCSAWADDPLPDRMLIDFEQDFEEHQLRVDEGTARLVKVKGNRLLEMKAAAGKRVKIRLFPRLGNWDLQEFVNLTLDVTNASDGEAFFRMLIKDPATTDESWYRPNLSHNGWVKPGETRTFPALLVRHKQKSPHPSYMDIFPQMHGLPNAQMFIWFGVDVSQITEVVLSLEPQEFAQTVRIDNLRGSRRASPSILETDPDAFFPFIDIYGQYMHEEWPGKVHSDADLIAQKEAEEKDMADHPHPEIFNQYGGWAGGPAFEATGHFRTQKVDGKWWFIDPAGKLFWSLGCNNVGLHMKTVDLGEKERFYADLTSPDDPMFGKYRTKRGSRYDSKGPVYEKKYGPDFEEFYHRLSLRRVRSWGLNTLGGWSPSVEKQPDGLRIPYVINLNIKGRAVKPVEKLADPFDPGFEKAVADAINEKQFSKNDPFCIGYFDNNEIPWGRDAAKIMREVLEQCDDSQPMKKELLRFLKKKGADDRAALLEFYRRMLETCHLKCRDAIRAAAPGKLYLGNRIYDGALRNDLVEVQAQYCDVISFNIYEKDVDQFNVRDRHQQPFFQIDKPFLIGEFNFGAVDRGKFFTGIGFAADQRNRGENYIRYVKSALNNPRCIGAHWFTYCDSPTGGRTLNGENANCGVISVADTPYPELIEAMRAAGQMIYPVRSGK